MNNEDLTKKTVEQAEDISTCKADIKEIFERLKKLEEHEKEHGKLLESINEWALNTKELAGNVRNVEERLEIIEQNGRQKNFAVWQIAASALIGGIITFAMTMILGG